MRSILISCFFLFGTLLFGQKEIVKIGVLPTTYGEGISPSECIEFENNILKAINKIPRYELVKRQKDFAGVTLGTNLEEQRTILQKQGRAASVNFLLHISFGDTEWQSKNVDINTTFGSRAAAIKKAAQEKRQAEADAKALAASKNTANKETKENTQKIAGKGNANKLPGKQSESNSATLPGKNKSATTEAKKSGPSKTATKEREQKAPVKKVWIHNAKMWVTINLYNVATGELENSIKVYAESFYDEKYKKALSQNQGSFPQAVQIAQARILKSVKTQLKTLKPLDIQLEKAVAFGTGGRLYTVQIKDAAFYGLKKGDGLFVYKEKPYLIKGEEINLERKIGEIEILEIKNKIAICEVKKGNNDLAAELEAGTPLKCNLSSLLKSGYGF